MKNLHMVVHLIIKDNIKKELQPMTVNIKYLMDMNIKSWHYIVILFYNKKKGRRKTIF